MRTRRAPRAFTQAGFGGSDAGASKTDVVEAPALLKKRGAVPRCWSVKLTKRIIARKR